MLPATGLPHKLTRGLLLHMHARDILIYTLGLSLYIFHIFHYDTAVATYVKDEIKANLRKYTLYQMFGNHGQLVIYHLDGTQFLQ